MTTGASQINTSCRSIAQRCPQIAPSRHGEGGPSSHLINGSSGIPKSTPQMASWFCLAILVQLMAVTDTHTHRHRHCYICSNRLHLCTPSMRYGLTINDEHQLARHWSTIQWWYLRSAIKWSDNKPSQSCSSEARLTYILRLSYHNAEVMIDLRWSSNLQNILRRAQGFSNIQFTCKIIRSS